MNGHFNDCSQDILKELEEESDSEQESYMWPTIEMKFSAFMEAIQFHIE